MEKRHFDEIDVAKGIGILLVILGHCFPDVSTSEGISIPVFRWIHDAIYTFHMPLMFMLAGFLSQRIFSLQSIKDKSNYIQDRFLRLMVPYFVIGFLYMPVKLLLAKFASQPYDINTLWQIFFGENPDGGLWYLWALFILQCLLSLLLTKGNSKYIFPLSAIVSLFILGFRISFFRLDDAIYYAFFVIFGMIIGANYFTYKNKLNVPITIVLSLVLCISVVLTVENEVSILKFLCGIAGSLTVIAISCQLIHNGQSVICRTLKYMGKQSMDIYVMHGIVMTAIRIVMWSILKCNYYVCTITMMLGGLIVPMFVSKYILRKSKILSVLILGEKAKKA